MTFIPFARDALSVAVFDGGTGTATNAVLRGQLTRSLLASWYATPGTPASITINGSTYTVNLCLPQAGAGTRKLWFQDLGVTDPGTSTGCDSLEQNGGNTFEATAAASYTSNGSFSIFPFSVASWISQVNGKAVDRSSAGTAAGIYLNSLDEPVGSGTQVSPYTANGSGVLVPNTAFYQSTTWGANAYYVAPTSKVGAFGSSTYKAMFVGSTSQICSTAAQATANLFGFDSLTSSEGTCGSTALTGT